MESPADARAVGPEPTSTEDTEFCLGAHILCKQKNFAVEDSLEGPLRPFGPCCAMTTAAPPMRFALGALLPLKGEDIVVLT